jgi:hypothetical protein
VRFIIGGSAFILFSNRLDLTTWQIITTYAYRWQVEIHQPDYTSSKRWAISGLFAYHQRCGAARAGKLVPATPLSAPWRTRMFNSTSAPSPPRA